MFREKYKYNPELVKYEKIRRSFREWCAQFLGYFFIYLIGAVLLNIVFITEFETPKEKQLERKQQDILTDYKIMNKRLDKVRTHLQDIQQRDDQVYRAIFELDRIPNSIRQAGFGGINRYNKLKKLTKSGLVIETARRIDKFNKQVYVQSKSFDEIVPLVKNKDKMISSVPAIQPVAIKDMDRISSYFGRRIDPYTGKYKWHHGMDFTGPVGTEIYATGNGKVIEKGYSNFGYGYEIIIDHGFGYKTRYAHLNQIKVEKGDQVERGEVIGLLGNSGRSTGPHLHYEVRKNDVALNPINFYFDDISGKQYETMVQQASKEGGTTMD